MLAPIVLFVYNRVDHLVKTLTALSQNDLAPESELIIYSDGPKASKDEEAVLQVRSFVKSFKEKDCFKSLTIVEAEKNKGLANSIISGVTEIISKYVFIIYN